MRYVATISKGNNYLKITDYYGEFCAQVIMPFCKANLYKYGKVPIPGSRKHTWKVTHVFARSNHDKSEYRIPASLLKEFLEFAQYRGYNESRIKLLEEEVLEGKPCDFKIKKGFENPREHQVEWINYQLADGRLKINNAATGQGKFQTLTSKVKVPGGWKKMGDIKPGDTVTAWDGTPTKVNAIYPQGMQRVFRVYFEDGRYTDAGLDHLWKIYDICGPKTKRYDRGNEVRSKAEVEANRWRVVDTKELIEILKIPTRAKRIYVPLIQSEQVEDKVFKIHPYLMGVLLGDGGFSGKSVVTVTKPYQQIFDKVESLLPGHIKCEWVDNKTFTIKFQDVSSCKNGAWHPRHCLRSYNLMGARSWEKRIPDEYLNGSTQQRLELLQGLMDTDGTVGKTKEISFSSTSKELAMGVQYLVRSLGGIASISTRTTKYSHNGEKKDGRLSYDVNIRYPRPEELFTIDHKKKRSVAGQYSDKLKLRITRIEERQQEECQCIAVDHPDHLYVTDDFIVTHNTFMALYTMVKLGVRTLITVQPRYVTTWINDIAKTVDVNPEDVLIWENSSLPLLGENIEKGLIDPKIIILPMTRISGYLRNTRLDPTMPSLDDIFKQINAGYRIIDEGHESFHEISLSLMYGNFAKCLLLSATLKSDDPFTNRMYKVMLPPNIRLKEPDPENYIDVVAYAYQLCQRKYRLKTTQFGSYNDLALEESILKNDLLTKFYYQIAKKAFTDYYLSVREPDTKCLFFFSRINMSQVMLELFQKDFPELDFATFLGTLDKKDPEKYLKHEIVITTPGSCGTGKDIPGLVTVICFHTVFSDQRNKQMIGRLRDLRGKFDGRITPTFVFPVCVDIPKHKDCFKKREQAFSAKQKTFKLIDSNCVLV